MWWQVPNIWQGGDDWIIRAGSSIVEQFEIPTELVTKVRNQE